MATGGLGHNSVESCGGCGGVGFTKSVTGRNRIAGNEGFTRAKGFADPKNATTADAGQYAVRFLSRACG